MTNAASSVLSLGELLLHQPVPKPCLIEPGLLPPQGIFFCGGEPKVGKSLLVASKMQTHRSSSLFSIRIPAWALSQVSKLNGE